MKKLTKLQDGVLWNIANGVIVKRSGHGFSIHTSDGKYYGKASISVKSLISLGLVALIEGDRVYLTSAGWKELMQEQFIPKGETARLTALADARVEYVKSMMSEDILPS